VVSSQGHEGGGPGFGLGLAIRRPASPRSCLLTPRDRRVRARPGDDSPYEVVLGVFARPELPVLGTGARCPNHWATTEPSGSSAARHPSRLQPTTLHPELCVSVKCVPAAALAGGWLATSVGMCTVSPFFMHLSARGGVRRVDWHARRMAILRIAPASTGCRSCSVCENNASAHLRPPGPKESAVRELCRAESLPLLPAERRENRGAATHPMATWLNLCRRRLPTFGHPPRARKGEGSGARRVS